MEKKESRDPQASASPEVISLMTGDREVNISQEKIEEVSLNIESVRKRLFSNGEVVEHREGGESGTLRQDLKNMEERLMKNQSESESRIKKSNMEAYDQCRQDMMRVMEMGEEKLKKEVDRRVAQAISTKADKSENEELRLKVARLENALE